MCTPIPSSFLYRIYYCTLCTKSTLSRENVTKDNNSIVHNDELFHTIEERYILGEEGNKSPDCNVKIVHVT